MLGKSGTFGKLIPPDYGIRMKLGRGVRKICNPNGRKSGSIPEGKKLGIRLDWMMG